MGKKAKEMWCLATADFLNDSPLGCLALQDEANSDDALRRCALGRFAASQGLVLEAPTRLFMFLCGGRNSSLNYRSKPAFFT